MSVERAEDLMGLCEHCGDPIEAGQLYGRCQGHLLHEDDCLRVHDHLGTSEAECHYAGMHA